MPVHDQYTRELRERFGYSATWIPTLEIRLGDVGRLAGHRFERLGTLTDYNLEFECREGEAFGSVDYASSTGVQISTRSTAEFLPANSSLNTIDGAATVRFTRDGAVLFNAESCTTDFIEHQQELEVQILALYEQGKWPLDNVFVTELVRSERATILISGGRDAVIDLRGSANAGVLSAGQGLQVVRSHNMSTQIIAQGGLTPLFRAKGIRKRLLQKPSIVSRKGAVHAERSFSPVSIEEVDYEHFS